MTPTIEALVFENSGGDGAYFSSDIFFLDGGGNFASVDAQMVDEDDDCYDEFEDYGCGGSVAGVPKRSLPAVGLSLAAIVFLLCRRHR